MERKNTYTIVSIIILAALAVVVWNLPDEGGSTIGQAILAPFSPVWTSPWDGVDVEATTAAGQAWLDSESGEKAFSKDVFAGEAVPIFYERREIFIWAIPVMEASEDDGQVVLGYIQVMGSDLDEVTSYTTFPEPRASFVNRETAIDINTLFILKYGAEYDPDFIKEPFIVVKEEGGGFHWMSEIVENGQIIDRIYSRIEFE